MTAPHISDELPRMLTGEADRDTVLAAAVHLRECIDCQHELVSALVAHASLTSAHRFAPEIVSGLTRNNFTDAAEDSPDRPARETTRSQDGPTPLLDLAKARHAAERDDDDLSSVDQLSSVDHDVPLPDLSAVFAQVRAEAAANDETSTVVPLRTRSNRTRYLVGAAAAAVIVGAGGVVYGVTANGDSGSGVSNFAGSDAHTVRLAAYDKGTNSATAEVGNGSLTINASSLPKLTGKRYEVWLTNGRRTAMQPIGWIGSDGKAAMTVPVDLMTKYTNVEVSVQNLDADDYTYSNVSVLRGNLD